ncbi:MAG: gliding motility-associated C-terminal domain-containing protein [Treponema sp.]|nr:gliding motility-associated C-terminal domain-containing protein [Treponema sp.]
MFRKIAVSLLTTFIVIAPAFSQTDGATPIGTNTAQDLYAPSTAGRGGFITSKGGAPASALNPAAEGDAQRIIFDIGYLGLPGFGSEPGYGNAVNLGAVFPTRVGVFGGSFRFLQSPFNDFPVGTSFQGNLNAAKELYPGINLGLGLNFGFNSGNSGIFSGDLGFRYNMGNLGKLENFTWALTLRSMGKSWIPSMFTPVGGLAFDFLHIKGPGEKDPLRMGFAADLYFPTFQNLAGKAGLNMVIADLITVSASSQFNLKETIEGNPPSPVPSIGIAANIKLKSGGRRLVGGTLPSDGELAVDLAAKPLYNGIWAAGGGLTWTVGVADKTPPVITVDYPEPVWISPNNDGKADDLEFPIVITDQRYIAEWVWEISNESGEVVRTYRNKELRPETQGVRNFLSRIAELKSGVDVPPGLRWDGVLESGAVAPDGRYTFVLKAADDNGNAAVSETYTVMVDNTPPVVTLEPFAEGDNIFSPDGDGNKDAITIAMTGSREDLWEAGIYDASGEKVRAFNFSNWEPTNITWNGTNDNGDIVPDGVYSFRITATDKALNAETAELGNIIVSTIQPQVSVLIGDAWFSPNGDGIKDLMPLTLQVPVKDGIVSWEVQIRDNTGNTRRTIPGSGGIPARLDFDGKSDIGAVLGEESYWAALSLRYRNGYVSAASSPAFTLDITPPQAAVRVEGQDRESGSIPVFSPNNDGNKDELVILQEGSNELSWIGEIRRAGETTGPAVRSFRFQGTPPDRIVWDGMNNAGALSPDGTYVYELFSTDPAGNTGRSNKVEFEIFTKDTPILLATDLRAFSPNGDGVRDTINFLPQIQEVSGITSWKLEIQNIDNGAGRPLSSSATTIRTIEGRNQAPQTIPWNGRTDSGAMAQDGTYIALLSLEYRSGNRPSALSRAFALDTSPPEAELSVPFTIFSPNGDGSRDYLPIQVNTEGSDEWNAVITDAWNNIVKSWNWTGRAPALPLPWDGADQVGNNAPDGTYTFTLSSTDEAGNSTRKTLSGITVDSRIPRAFLTASSQAIAPKPNQASDAMRFSVILSPQEGIESWKLELKNENNQVVRTFAGTGSAPPGAIGWSGTDDKGIIREGRYTPALTVSYIKGDTVTQTAPQVTVDISGPILGFNSRPQYFSPDNDGVEDELFIALSARDASPIANWSLEIHETEGTKQLFWRIEGRGSPSERIVWDGRSNKGELVQGATDYSYTYQAADALGNSSVIDGVISTDVLVIRDGDMLKILVPSITFRANAADFDGLPADRIETNTRVLRRIAEILNKFRDYKITVEGHANPVLGTQKEETEELQPLSLARARAIIEQLVNYEVSRSRLSAIGRGGTRTVVNPQDLDNRWKNRRVEFILLK